LKRPADLRWSVRGGKRGGEQSLEFRLDKKAQLVIALGELSDEEKQVDKPPLLRLIRLAD